ncbi:MAG: ferrochelatase [Fibrobacterales bacterium]|nr:ferrochelatase [Fibrobacterales bacterium]
MSILARIFQHFKTEENGSPDPTKAVLLVDFGSPESKEEYKVFLDRILSTPDLLSPFPPVRWWKKRQILAKRLDAGWQRYLSNGGSPLKRATGALARGLSAALHGTQVGCAYIYGEPQIHDAVAKMAKSGIRELTVLPLHPHSSLLTRTAARDALARVPFGLGIPIDVVMPYGEHPFFVTWWKQLVKQAIYANKMTAPHLLFVAPSVPKRFAARRDNKFAGEVEASCRTIALTLGLEWSLAFSSPTQRNAKWMGPTPEATLDALAKKNVSEALILPIAFMVENIVTSTIWGSGLDLSRWPSMKIARVRLADGRGPCEAQEELDGLLYALVQSAQNG